MLPDTGPEVTALAQFNKESFMEYYYARESIGEGEGWGTGTWNWLLDL